MDQVEHRFSNLLLQLRLIASDAKTTAWNPRGKGTADDVILSDPFDRPRRIDPDPEWWLLKWNECLTDGRRERLCDRLEREVRKWKRSRYVASQHRGTHEWRVAIALAAGSAREVAGEFEVHENTVYRYRAEFGEVAA